MKQPQDFVTLDFFPQQTLEAKITVEERIKVALATLAGLFVQDTDVVTATSFGKDSSICLALVLHAAAEAKRNGLAPRVWVLSADTLVESPEVARHAKLEMQKVRSFAKRHGLNVRTRFVSPNILSSFQVKVLSGRALPSFAGTNTSCSVDWKVTPMANFRSRLFRQLKKEGRPEPVTVLGTRFSESVVRDSKMRERGESAAVPVRNKNGELILSLIADWQTDDVWEALALYGSGQYESYSTFEETFRIYAHSGGTSCAIVSESLYEGKAKRSSGGCGARLGCWSCQRVAADKSLTNMVEYDPRYRYAAGLVRLNNYLRARQYDWTTRHFVGRTVIAGYLVVQPDTYHPTFIRELMRMMLTLDYEEELLAQEEGRQVMFRILPVSTMVAVDAMQSLNGTAAPFAIWADYRDIRERGIRYPVPVVEAVPPQPLPDAKFLYVGERFDSTLENKSWSGLRNSYFEALTSDSPCAPELIELKNGHMGWKLPTAKFFSVNDESALMIEEFEALRLAENFDRGFLPGGITSAYFWYLSYGALEVSYSQQQMHDDIARRTAYKDQLKLTLEYDIKDLLARSVDYKDLPPEARKAWANRVSTESAQVELEFD